MAGLQLLALSAAAPVGAQVPRSADLMAAEASGFYQASRNVRDPADRGRLTFMTQLRLDQIKATFPQSVAAAELAFGRFQDIDALAIEREAGAWAKSNSADADALRKGAISSAGLGRAAAGATGGSLAIPRFGATAPATPAMVEDGSAGKGGGQVLTSIQLAERLRESAVFIYVPGNEGVSTGSGFFISPTHVLTNTHVVEGADQVVIANRTIGVRSAKVVSRGMTSNRVGVDTAVLSVDGWTNATALPFAAAVQEGDSIAIAGYPGKAAVGIDKAYMNFMQLIRENRIPTRDNIPNVKFDFGFVQSLFTNSRSGLENAQIGIMLAPGSSGSPVVNRCGEVVAQAYSVTNTRLDIARSGNSFVATGEAMTFSFALALRELTRFLSSTNASITVSKAACGQG